MTYLDKLTRQILKTIKLSFFMSLLVITLCVNSSFGQLLDLKNLGGFDIEIANVNGVANNTNPQDPFAKLIIENSVLIEDNLNTYVPPPSSKWVIDSKESSKTILVFIRNNTSSDSVTITHQFGYETIDGATHSNDTSYTLAIAPNSSTYVNFDFDINLGTSKQVCYYQILLTSPGGNISAARLYAISTGPTRHAVDSLGTIKYPEIPYMILHDPPGDGSSAEFQMGKQVCREIADTYTSADGVNAAAAVSIGVAGEAGIIVTQKFEFSVTLSAKFGYNYEKATTNSVKQCLENLVTYTTSSLNSNIGEGADLFIGHSQDYAFGISENIIMENSQPVLDTSLALAALPGASTFAWTQADILNQFEGIQTLINDASADPVARARAQNQMDVWNQVIILNEENKANASNQSGTAYSISGGGSMETHEEKIQTSTVTGIDVKVAYSGGLGIEAVAQVGATGFTGSVEYAMSRTLGASEVLSGDSSKMIKFTMIDDDAGDLITGLVYDDPTYGTPVFKSQSTSKSSCPYETGQRRDKPRIQSSFIECDPNTSYFDAVPYGTQAATNVIFNLEICNDGDIDGDRTFSLGVTNNLNSAKVTALGTVLNNTNSMANITVNMQQCTTISVTFQRDPQAVLPGNAGYLRSKDIYDNVILTLAPACGGNTEGDEADVHALFVTFGDPSNYIDEACYFENNIYTFENIPYGTLDGKDGWVDIHTTHDENIIQSNFSANYDHSKAMSGEGWLVRPNDSNWGFSDIDTNDIIKLEMDVYMNAYSIDNTSNSAYLQSDLDNNGSYIVNETRFGMRVEYNNNNIIVPQIYINDGRNYIVGTSIPWTTNGYIRFQLVLDPVTNIMTMSYKDLTNNGSWITISSLQNVVLFTTPGGASTTAFYAIDGISVWHIGAACLTDNIAVQIESFVDSDLDGIKDLEDLCPATKDVVIDFDGVDDLLFFQLYDGNGAINIDEHFTIEAWVNPESNTDLPIFMTTDTDSRPAFEFRLKNQKFALVLFDTTGSPSSEYLSSATNIPLNEWSHLAISFDANTKKATFYLNGELDVVQTSTLSNIYAPADLFGAVGFVLESSIAKFYEGRLDDIVLWSDTLSETFINQTMSAPLAGSEVGLQFYLNFNEGNACTDNTSTPFLDNGPHNRPIGEVGFNKNSCSSNWAIGRNSDSDGDGIGDACDELPCPPSLNLSGNQLSDELYKTDGDILSNQLIFSPANIEYNSATSVELVFPFEIQIGATLTTKNEGCD